MTGGAGRRSGLLLLGLLLTGWALVAAEPSVLLGVVGAALWAMGLARHASAVLRAASARGPAAVRRHGHRRASRSRVLRQLDPDAPGRTRARAPSGLLPAV
ncbi:DUF6412 domain-containing protein [Pseudonocardia sp. NPDC049154]|uniref:DUF6412 domain-containing protein n=1 Tax=Pseudonocardia sp. NPDC049154 TaxID=3155501 RepID=UPI0033F76C75